MSPSDSLLEINQAFIAFGSQITDMTRRCNHQQCNNNRTASEVYSIMRNEFALPLNYSFFNTNSTITATLLPSSGASFMILSYGFIVLLAIHSLLLVFFIE
ncbi:unnamed protein product [Rotaria magnacalcarata]|uniref:Uncharacterized protein n=1 Tax=Rotaria magnacalcarata TaxID=392030 RepID=A0A819MNE3_9BILA|nr:unnamed protein product [Rotaria magnacalcarata]CAF2057603.1 unnamed protein product [Rotaria magnacalcarata]CAF3981585.1 unnamed protein product [Rotaria magnacalcarata]CAF3985258.1 unnamed protein product [Rotaria magnacalcarata]